MLTFQRHGLNIAYNPNSHEWSLLSWLDWENIEIGSYPTLEMAQHEAELLACDSRSYC